MVRLRFLRVLLPALLVPFLLLLGFMFRQRPAPLSRTPSSGAFSGPQAESIELTDIWTGDRRLFIKAGSGRLDAEGRVRLSRVDRLEVDRRGRDPLVLRAERGSADGRNGHRVLRLEGGVEVEDEDAGIRLTLPVLEVDESRAEVRSVGAARFEWRGYVGTAASIRYSLDDEPTELIAPEMRDADGSELLAGRATLRQDPREMELEESVRLVKDGYRLQAERLWVERGVPGGLRRAIASGNVICTGLGGGAARSQLDGERVTIDFDEAGNASRAFAEGSPILKHEDRTLRATAIELRRRPASRDAGVVDEWDLRASGSVELTGFLDRSASAIHAEELHAHVGPGGTLRRAEAQRRVRLEGPEALGEAGRMLYEPSGRHDGTITLLTEGGQRARVARSRTRVSAQRIVTSPRGTTLQAEGQVEATLLDPRSSGDAAAAPGLFEAGDAVHVVASRLESTASGNHLLFTGAVRAWQGERNLSANSVEFERPTDTLRASGDVTTRFPRAPSRSLSSADFVQIGAETLDYDGRRRLAVYSGGARVRQAEGWLKSTRLDVELEQDGGGVREMRASGEVTFELRSSAGAAMPRTVMGRGDRVVYTPGEQLVRLFGDRAPASVRRGGEDGGTTTGRVLRYLLDAGTLDVESEERQRAGARASGG